MFSNLFITTISSGSELELDVRFRFLDVGVVPEETGGGEPNGDSAGGTLKSEGTSFLLGEVLPAIKKKK